MIQHRSQISDLRSQIIADFQLPISDFDLSEVSDQDRSYRSNRSYANWKSAIENRQRSGIWDLKSEIPIV
jgi:hypothetical protein